MTEGLQQPIGFTVQVLIPKVEDGKASIIVPPEIRLTPNLIRYIKAALEERGLELAHMEITPEHKRELESIPNVVVQEEQAAE